MPHERKKDHKGTHHTPDATDPITWWQKFHFSGKVIMCSVLFGFGLVLIGGLLLAIGADKHEEENNKNLNEIQNKAPMSIVGPVIMGIGCFTVVVGVTMCLFETNICRKRQPDSRPLIQEQNSESASKTTGTESIPSTSHKREKHRHYKKSSSSRKHKGDKKSDRSSPSSMPIDMHRSLSRDLTSSDKFLTPQGSLVYEHPKVQPTYSDAENQTSASLLKSFTSSGKTWDTSTEFQTPASSLQDSSSSFGGREESLGLSPELNNDRLKDLTHEFVTPQNSNADILDDKSSSSSQETVLTISQQVHSDGDAKSKDSDEEIPAKLNHDFVTPMNSYVDQPNLNAPRLDMPVENDLQIATNVVESNLAEKSLKENSSDSSAHKIDVREEKRIEEAEFPNNESVLRNAEDLESKQISLHSLEKTADTPEVILAEEDNSHTISDVPS